MQTSGQFGVPPPEVPSPYTAVNKNINTHGSNNVSSNHGSNSTVPSNRGSTTCTPAGNQAQPGHQLLFNLSPSDQQPQQHFLASPSAFAASTSHGPPSGEILGRAGDLQEQNDHLLSLQATPAHHHQKDNTETTQIKLHQQHSTNLNQLASMNLAPATQPTEHEQQRPPVSLGLDQSIAQITNGTLNNDITGDSDMVQTGGETMAMAEMDQGDDGAGSGNRWPRQETLALLKIRADMDALFRDTSVKRPLWDEVSRKLGELGYERSAKKCKEKFENVNKYYKRTKEGKAGRQDGKNYRFFSQLEALAANNNPNPHSNNNNNNNTSINNPHSSNNNNNNNNNTSINNSSNPMMTTSTPISSMLITNSVSSYMDSISRFKAGPSDVPLVSHAIPTTTDPSFLTTPPVTSAPSVNPNHDAAYRPILATNLNLSFESSDEDDDADVDDEDNIDDEYDDPVPQSNANAQPDEGLKVPYRKRKRTTSAKMMDFFEGLLNKVIEKQEQMQQKFLQALEKRETDRMIREEAWRRQEMARLSKENELRAQERTSAATRDAALIAFLQKVTGQNVDFTVANVSTVAIAAQPVQTAPPLHHGIGTIQPYEEQDPTDPGSKRWLREEVLALIELHNSLQSKFTEAGPKGPLWEEIAQGMTRLGFSNRTAKRCKEKWENINKYFKRAKESNKKRPENAKTCPYFRELEAIHNKGMTGGTEVMTSSSSQQLLQLPYKPMMEYTHADIDSVEHKPSASSYILEHNGRGDRNITPSMPVHGAASVSIVNANTGHANIGNSINNGALQSKATAPLATGSVQLTAGAAQAPICPVGLSPADRPSTNGRGDPISDLGLNMENQTTPALLDLHQHEPNSQGAEDVGSTQGKESGPSLAPLPNSSSFMSNMLPKLSSNNSSAPSATIQGQ